MGVDFYCENYNFSTSYSRWNEIRLSILTATLNYLNYTFDNNNVKSSNDADNYNYFMNKIKTVIEINKNYQKTYGELCVNYFISSLKETESFIYFNVFGIYVLFNKSDCEGFYSPGNALDICYLLNLIKPYMINTTEFNTVYVNNSSVYNLFNESREKYKNIIIS